MNFDDMTPLQRRLHNASCVLDADGDEYGFVALLRETIDALAENDQKPQHVEDADGPDRPKMECQTCHQSDCLGC